MISYTRQEVRFVTGIGFCVFDITHETRGAICYRIGFCVCDMTHETGGTICYGHWVLRLVISHTRQRLELVPQCSEVRFVAGAWPRTSTQVLRSTICCRCLRLELVSAKKYDLLPVSGARASTQVQNYDLLHERGGTICFGHWVLCLVISHTRQGVRFVTGIGFCVL